MAASGKIEEIIPGTGWYKIRTDHDDFTVYEIQNRSEKAIIVQFSFVDCLNVRFEPGQLRVTETEEEDGPVFVAEVKPGETLPVVTLFTDDEDEDWEFDYDLEVKESGAAEWLSPG